MSIGCDIVQVKRIVKQRQTNLLQRRILTIAEQDYIASKSNQKVAGRKYTQQHYSLAAMFAAKEATLKALGMGLGQIALNKIEVLHKSSGQPYINIDQSALQALNISIKDASLSISHDGEYAMAVVQLNAR